MEEFPWVMLSATIETARRKGLDRSSSFYCYISCGDAESFPVPVHYYFGSASSFRLLQDYRPSGTRHYK
jgi:hypothetical protein